jgi:uncharacterized protein YecE (DUF72 family)
MADVRIGTSGWTYDGWRGPFYPVDVPKRRWLQWYASQFNSVEVNGSFYLTPSLEAVRGWRDQTSEGFTFAWKASKFITHWKRLSHASTNSLELMETRLKALGPKLGTVLFQLPARFTVDRDRLAAFLRLLKRRRRYAFEFRDKSWYDESIYELLAENNIAFCISDHHDAPAPWLETADHAYIRGHGPTGEYHSNYTPQQLGKWAAAIKRCQRRGHSVSCYFDNDQKSAAPRDATKLRKLLDGKR